MRGPGGQHSLCVKFTHAHTKTRKKQPKNTPPTTVMSSLSFLGFPSPNKTSGTALSCCHCCAVPSQSSSNIYQCNSAQMQRTQYEGWTKWPPHPYSQPHILPLPAVCHQEIQTMQGSRPFEYLGIYPGMGKGRKILHH